MMKLQNAQRGFTFWSLSFYLILLGFVVLNGLKLFPIYAEAATVESAVRSIESDKLASYTGAMSVKNALFRRMAINNVSTIRHEDVSVIRDGRIYVLNIEYEVRVPYFQNIDLIFSFDHHAEVSAE